MTEDTVQECLVGKLAALTAENARLRRSLGNAQVLADERRTEIERLTADLARVVESRGRVAVQRDGLLAAAKGVLAADHYQEDDDGVEYGSPHLAALRIAVACAPPASGEEGQP